MINQSINSLKFLLNLCLIWMIEPLMTFLAVNLDMKYVSEVLIVSKDFVNVIVSVTIGVIAILNYKKKHRR